MERFGRYLLLERIATGGMAEVFRAAATGSAGFFKQVAIKRIHPHLANDDVAMEMMVREAKIASELDHPNIIRVLDLGSHGQSHFIAMEYVAGQALQNIVTVAKRAGRPLPLGFSLFVVQQALQGLAYAHGRRDHAGKPMDIVHRDVSPSNVMVSYDGAVQLLDFGIARASEQASQTQMGTLRGKPAYFSPEILHGAPITQDLDVYAMGVVLFELLASRKLRVPRDDTRSWTEVVDAPVPTFEEMGVVVPPQVAALVARALAKDPKERWPSAVVFAAAVTSVMRELNLHVGPPDVVELLSRMFAAEIELEAAARAKFHATVTAELAAAPAVPADWGAANLVPGLPPPVMPASQPSPTKAPWWAIEATLPALVTQTPAAPAPPAPPPAGPTPAAPAAAAPVPAPAMRAVSIPVPTRGAPVMETRRAAPAAPARVSDVAAPAPQAPPTRVKTNVKQRLTLGLDFGTSNTCASYVTPGGHVRVVPVSSVDNVLPTVVWYSSKDKFVVGAGAREQIVRHPENTVYGFKRFLGRRFRSEFVNKHKDRFLYKLVEGVDGDCAVEIMGEVKPLKDLAFHVIHRMLELAQADAGRDIEDCVLSVPAHYGYRQRLTIRTAAEMAGLEVRALINEPTAAAVFYARQHEPGKTALVYDLGGGTFDATLIAVENHVVRVLATGGDAFLGGADFDERIAQVVAHDFQKRHGIDLRAQRVVMQRLIFACEMAKIALSQEDRALVRVPFVAEKDGVPLDVEYPLTRSGMDIIIAPLIESTVGTCEDLLKKAGIKPASVGETILVGGQTRTQALKRRIFMLFPYDPEKQVNPDVAVCSGAAVLGHDLDSPAGPKLVDVVSQGIWFMTPGGPVKQVITANTPVPCLRRVQVDTRPAAGPMTFVVFEALEATSSDRGIFGTITLDADWLAQNPGPIQLEFRMAQNFSLEVAVSGTATARTPVVIKQAYA